MSHDTQNKAKPKPDDKPELKPDVKHKPTPSLAPDLVIDPTEQGQRFVIDKQGMRYEFICTQGSEQQLIQHLADLAEDEHHPVNWFDAVRIAHALGLKLSRMLKHRKP